MDYPKPGTPLPWHSQRYTTPGLFVTETCIRSADESYIAKIGPCAIEANTAYIIHAANNYQELRKAALELHDALGNSGKTMDQLPPKVQEALMKLRVVIR